MTAVAPAATPQARFALDARAVEWEAPNSALAGGFEGIAMVQSFSVRLPGGEVGRCWLPTDAALRVIGLGRAWVAGRLAGHAAVAGWDAVQEELLGPGGLRLD